MLSPRQRRQRVLIGAALVVLVVVATTLYFTVFRSSSDHHRGAASVTSARIAVDGIELAAQITTPAGVARPPLVIIPGSFGAGPATYQALAASFAADGYLVLAYGQRGFGGSTGKIDFAGPATQRDARQVITWALAHTKANPARVGMLGISYGGGISLLTAAHDRRVRAVAALSTWADFADSYLDTGTPHVYALKTLLGDKSRAAAYDPELRRLQTTLLDEPRQLGPVLADMSPVRSPATYVDGLNQNKPAIMIANAFQDSYFGPSQLVPFFAKLTTPKRLELAAGDHGGPERSSLTGQPNDVIRDATAWFDHYLKASANGIQSEDPIVLRDGRTGDIVPYSAWPAATDKDRTPLPKPGVATGSTAAPTSTWVATIESGADSGADAGPIQLVPSTSYRPPTLNMNTLETSKALIWNGPQVTSGLRVSGTPSVTLDVAASAPTATLFAYLYDVTSEGIGTLIDLQPWTATNLAKTTRPHVITLPPITWSVPAGDHLTLVIDTVDPHFQSLTQPGTTITVASNTKQPSTFTAPVGR